MHEDPLTAGLLGVAKRWSLVGLAIGLGIVVLLGAANLAYSIAAWIMGDEHPPFVVPLPMHSWTLMGLAVLVICSFGTQLIVHQMIYMRRTKLEVEELKDEVHGLAEQMSGIRTILAAATAPRPPEPHRPTRTLRRRTVEVSTADGVFQLPSPRAVAAVRRLAAKVIDKR